jgi:hypothetical protein
MHRYTAFGLNLESEIPLDGLLPNDINEVDVSIRLGKVAPLVNAAQAFRTQVTLDTFLLDKERVARFRVERGERITVSIYPGSSPEEIKAYLLGSCMGATLLQRKILPLHGSCICDGRLGVLLTGRSGAGKSTIAAGFLAKGFGILTDDVAAVRFGDAHMPVVSPSYPRQKLWEDAVQRVPGVHSKMLLCQSEDNRRKFSVARDGCFCRESARLAAVYEIVPGNVPSVSLEEITGAAKVQVLLNNIYRRRMAYRMGIADWCYLSSMRIAQNVKVFRVIRPEGTYPEDWIVERILETRSFALHTDSPELKKETAQ